MAQQHRQLSVHHQHNYHHPVHHQIVNATQTTNVPWDHQVHQVHQVNEAKMEARVLMVNRVKMRQMFRR
jgi:hypothetical protein